METQHLESKLHEVYTTEPTDLGTPFLTNIYKGLTRPLKTIPFVILLPTSFLLAVCLYIVLGLSFVKIVTLLQNGF